MSQRVPPAAGRLPALAGWLLAALLVSGARAQAQQPVGEVSALPPPVTRSLYRSHWFAFLNALTEDEPRTANVELVEIEKAARTVGVKRLSDFARAAVHEGRLAEAAGKPDRALRAYDAAMRLDDASYDAVASKIEFLVRQKQYGEATRLAPVAALNLFSTREPRVAVLSTLGLCASTAVTLAALGFVAILLLHSLPRVVHDAREVARRFLGPSGGIPLAFMVFLLPAAFGLGPVWLLLWAAVLLHAYAGVAERRLLVGGLVALGLVPILLAVIAQENILRRSPLYVAAVDLDERREDGSAEDALRQAASVFPEDADVWFLLGIFAERSGDTERAVQNYDRAIQANPKDYRPYLNRGNVHFQEGDFAQAVADYNSAAERAPGAAEVFYNLSIAKGESYDFDGQTEAIGRARQLSPRDVDAWSSNPSLTRVVAAPYGVARARRRVEAWNGEAKSRKLPGHTPPAPAWKLLISPYTLGPWIAALLAVGVTSLRARDSLAAECLRCGKAMCGLCRRAGDSPLYCADCVRLHIRKEPVGIEAHVIQAGEIRKRTRFRDRLCRLASLVLPGTHDVFSGEPGRAAVRLAVFGFAAALAFVGETIFDPRQLPPSSEWRGTVVVGLLTAFVVWASSVVSAWKGSHGS
jgi:tetratricopeptide (TPR) repeat protein